LSNSYCNSYWGYHGGFGWHSHTVIIHNSSWGRTWVNHTTYIHTWGGSNRGFYARPNAYVNTNVYHRNTAVYHSNTNVNVNRNVNVNKNTNVNVNKNANVYHNTGVNQGVNRNSYPSQSASRNTYNSRASAPAARGYSKPSSAHSGTFSGVQNGRAEQHSSARGRAGRGR
jgi:hypothetical protein